MLHRSRSSLLLSTLGVTAALGLALAGCGDDEPSASAALTAQPARTPSQDTPPAAVAPGVLGSIADVAPARQRLAYVNPQALSELGGPLAAAQITKLVLGETGAARLARADGPAPTAAVQVGPATVLASGADRTVTGAGTALARQLADPEPAVALITAETPSAVQSCLGDAAAVIVGPAVMGRMSSVGAAVINTNDAPAGPKLMICAAPHYARDLHRTEDRLKARFPAEGVAAGVAPVVAEQEIGEREIVGAAVALGQVDPALLRDLIAGGPALRKLAGG